MERFGMKEDEIIESSFISRTIERVQERVEKQNFDIRKHLLEYDDVLNQQRIVVYRIRRDVLEGRENIIELVRDMISRLLKMWLRVIATAVQLLMNKYKQLSLN